MRSRTLKAGHYQQQAPNKVVAVAQIAALLVVLSLMIAVTEATPAAWAAGSTGWTSPFTISLSDEHSQGPALGTTEDSTLMAAWRYLDTDTGLNRLRVATRAAGASAWEYQALSGSGTNVYSQPQLAVNDSGDAVVLWEENCTGQQAGCFVLKASVREDSGPWAAESRPFEAVTPGVEHKAQVSIAEDGRAVAVWAYAGGIEAATIDLGDTEWSQFQLEDDIGAANSQPAVAAGNSGRTVVVWQRSDGNYTVKAASKGTGVIWAETEISPASPNSGLNPKVAITAGGEAHVVWSSGSGNESVQTVRKSPSGSWGAVTTLSSAATDATAQVAIDTDGNAVAAWAEQEADHHAVWVATEGLLSLWSDRDKLRGSVGADSIDLATADGRTVVAWRGTNGLFDAARNTAESDWTTGESLAALATLPQLAINADGVAALAWEQSLPGGQKYIAARQADLGAAADPDPAPEPGTDDDAGRDHDPPTDSRKQPRLSKFRINKSRFTRTQMRRSLKHAWMRPLLRLKLSRAATVRLTLQRKARSSRYLAVASFSERARTGRNHFRLPRLAVKQLSANGRYRLVAEAQGGNSQQVKLRIR